MSVGNRFMIEIYGFWHSLRTCELLSPALLSLTGLVVTTMRFRINTWPSFHKTLIISFLRESVHYSPIMFDAFAYLLWSF